MGKYLDLMQNMSISEFEFNETFGNDTFTPAISSANDFTQGYLGLGIILPIWFGLFQHLSNRENLFDMTPLQALISVNALIFSIAIVLVYIQILTVPQHFIWIASLVFIGNVIGILRTA